MKFFLVIIGLVLVIQNACAYPYIHHSAHGESHHCSTFEEEENMCHHGDDCVPLVVRPRDIPKPSVSVPVLNPIPGPCAHKKAIVKPAVIPKPVCLSHSHKSVIDSCHSHSTNVHHHHDNYVTGSHTLTGCGGSTGTHVSGGCGGSGTFISGSSSGTSVSGGSTGTYLSGTPADAVSLNLAYKLARHDCGYHAQSEDKLAFGFKKIPIEMPHKRVVKTSIPEEQIYSLNGQIVELKPICVSSHKSLDEEAAEDLLAMEAEEHATEMEHNPIKKLYLEEIGYGPAKQTSAQFVDIPASTTVVHGDSCSSSTHVSGCGCCCSKSKCTEYIPGNVEYKVIPKVDDIVIKLPEPEDSAESAEITISQEQGDECECACHCTPICVHKTHNRKHRKSSVYIEQYHH